MNAVRPKIRWLTDDAVNSIVVEARRVLAEIGVFVENKTATELLLDAGGSHSADKKRVLIPDTLVDRALSSAPSKRTGAASWWAATRTRSTSWHACCRPPTNGW